MEASIIVPLFIAATVLLVWIIPVIMSCENVVFTASDEMRMELLQTKFRKSKAALPAALQIRSRKGSPELDVLHIDSYRYLYSAGGMDDLVTLQLNAYHYPRTILGPFFHITFDGTLTGRAFTGTTRKGAAPGRGMEEDDGRVFVFPDRGKKMHDQNCRYLHSACKMTYLSQQVRKKYHACPNCSAKSAGLGTPVFLFEGYGEAYHTGECRSVSRYYVEMSHSEAAEKGYTDCLKCGGGHSHAGS